MTSRGTAALVLVTAIVGIGAPVAGAAPANGSPARIPTLSPTPPNRLGPAPERHPKPAAATTATTPAAPKPDAQLPFTGMNVELELGLAAALLAGGIGVASVARARRR